MIDVASLPATTRAVLLVGAALGDSIALTSRTTTTAVGESVRRALDGD